MLNDVSLKVGNKTLFDERSMFSLEEVVPKEEGNDHEASNEEGMKSMSFEKERDLFLEDLLLKMSSSTISLFRRASFLDAEVLVGAVEMIDGSL